MNEEEIKEMVRDCVTYAGFLSSKNLDHVAEIAYNLEKVKDITEMMRYVTVDGI